jgi:hypothetical protein
LKLYDRGIIVLLFTIAATNSAFKLYYWFFQSGRGVINFPYYGFLVTFCLATGLLLIKYFKNSNNFTLQRESPGFSIVFTLWLIAATLSLIWNVTVIDGFTNYISGIIVPMIIFLALRGFHPDDTKLNRIFIAVSLGLFTPLILGVAAYFREWGVPSLYTLAYSRYNLVKMESYMRVTYGNIGNFAQLILLTGPPLLVLALDKSRPLLLRIWFGGCLGLMGLNLLIIQSMTSFFVGLVVFLLLVVFRKYYRFFISSLFSLLIVGFTFNNFFVGLIRLLMGRQGSFFERIGAMRDGLGVFLENWVFGVGHGLSYLHISATTAHQFFIQQGLELGILGFISSILLVAIVFNRMLRIIISGSKNSDAVTKFILIIGPFAYLLYGVIANITINIGSINVWINLLVAFLALADFKTAADYPKSEMDDY